MKNEKRTDKSIGSTREPLIERYKKNTSRYTKALKIMDAILIIIVVLSTMQLFGWDGASLSYLIFGIFSTIFLIVYLVIFILDMKGRLKNDTLKRMRKK